MASDDHARARAMWRYTGDERPAFAESPRDGQESVWDYPRPPRLVPDAREVIVRAGNVEIARTRSALRMLETASPPTIYLPFADARADLLVDARGAGSSHCEWKGGARYLSIMADGVQLPAVAWYYPSPNAPYEAIAACFSVYPGRVECLVDGERVRAQEGGFYGGWVTNEIVGPWKGGPGTSGW
ncbi:MAG: DUF427 domain-containing protein [Gemmatimonadaceae bacterium]